jgi:hypothetical protein
LYYKAALKSRHEKQIYPLTNWLELEAILSIHNTNSRIKYEPELTPEIAMERLDYFKNRIGSSPEDYWAMIAKANIQLCFLLRNKSGNLNTDEWDKFSNSVSDLWNKAGSPGMKSAEIENIFLLENALTLVDISQPAANAISYKIAFENINEYVERLKQALGKINSGAKKVSQKDDIARKNIAARTRVSKKGANKKTGRRKKI